MKFDYWYNMGWILVMRLACLALGLYLTYCEVTGTRDYYLAVEHDKWTWIVKAMIGVTVATAITPTAITMSFRSRQWLLALGFAIMLPAAILIVFAAAVSRTGASADMQHQAAQQAARNANLDTTVEQETYKALQQAKADTKTECDDGRGRNCKALEATREAAQKRWDDAVKAIKGETVSIADPWFSRAAALSKGLVTEDDMRTYWPAMPPIIVSVFAGLLIAFGTHFKSPRPHAPQPAPQIAPALASRRRWRPEMPRIAWRGKSRGIASQIAPHPNSAPLMSRIEDREVDDNEVEILEPERKPSLLRRKAPDLKLVATNNNFAIMGILDFIMDCLESGAATRVSEAEVFHAYLRRCRARGIKACSLEEFLPLLEQACKDCGIERAHKAGKVYLADVQLVRDAKAS